MSREGWGGPALPEKGEGNAFTFALRVGAGRGEAGELALTSRVPLPLHGHTCPSFSSLDPGTASWGLGDALGSLPSWVWLLLSSGPVGSARTALP